VIVDDNSVVAVSEGVDEAVDEMLELDVDFGFSTYS